VSEDRTSFEVLDPPDGSVPGDRISFEGYPGEPDKQLNPKKKVDTYCRETSRILNVE